MREVKFLAIVCVALLALSSLTMAQNTEQDIIDKYLQKAKSREQSKKVSWISGTFNITRINQNNNYNSFATYASNQMPNGKIDWLGNASSFGLEFGLVFNEKMAWSIGGEYWLKMGTNEAGPVTYNAPTGSITIPNLISEIQVYGFKTGFQYYVKGKPGPLANPGALAVRMGAGIGFYQATWDLWPEYQNLNLSTSMPDGQNISFMGSGPGFTMTTGVDYPTSWLGMTVGFDMTYQYLNLTNVAWYNTVDEEIVASYNGASNGRVDLNLSGVRGGFSIKRFFNW